MTWRLKPAGSGTNLSARIGNNVLFKREDMQPVFSFKLRGAYNKMAQLTPEQLKRGVIAALRVTMRRAWRSAHIVSVVRPSS